MRFHSLLLAVVFAVLVYALPVKGEDAAPPSGTSRRVLEDSGFGFAEQFTKMRITLFEDVNNQIYFAQGRLSEMQFYCSPVCFFPLPKKVPTGHDESNGFFKYSLDVLYFPPGALDQAVDVLNQKYATRLPANFKFVASNVGFMPHQLVTFSVPGLPEVRIPPIGSLHTDVSLGEKGLVECFVPAASRKNFEDWLAAGAGFNIDVQICYNAIGLKQAYVSWTAEDLTEAFNRLRLAQGGANFVSVDAARSVIQEVKSVQRAIAFEDPDMDAKLLAIRDRAFSQMMATVQSRECDNADEAKELDSKLRDGLHINTADFMPITLMQDMVKSIDKVDDYKTANQNLRQFSTSNKEKISASASGGYGPFSASVGYSTETERMARGEFRDQMEYETFRKECTTVRGKDAHIVPRGIKLLDASTFTSHIGMMASSLVVQPVSSSNKCVIRSVVKPGSSDALAGLLDANLTAIHALQLQVDGLKSSEAIQSADVTRLAKRLDDETAARKKAVVATSNLLFKIFETAKASLSADPATVPNHTLSLSGLMDWLSTDAGAQKHIFDAANTVRTENGGP